MQERVAGLEPLRQFLLLGGGGSQMAGGSRVEALSLGAQTQPCNGVVHLIKSLDKRVVVAQQARSRLQDIALKRRLSERKIVKRLKRHRIARSVRVKSTRQKPGKQPEQNKHPENARHEFHGSV